MLGIQPLLDRLLGVVRPLVQLAAAGIALALHLGFVEGDVIGSASLAHPPVDSSLAKGIASVQRAGIS